MSIVLSNDKLKDIFEKFSYNINDEQGTLALIDVLKPVLKFTLERFPQLLKEDIQQEILMMVLKKREYLTKAFNLGRIKNPTNYFFRFFRNAAIVFINKENKYNQHIVSIEDIKIEKTVKPKTYMKGKVLRIVRDEVIDLLKAHFVKQNDFNRSCKFLDLILNCERPRWQDAELRKFYGGRPEIAKESYAVVLQYVRTVLGRYQQELLEQ